MALVWTGGTGKKLEGIDAGPSTLGGWPRCGVCNKLVEEVTELSSGIDDTVRFVAHCHGEWEAVEISRQVLADMALHDLSFSGAFDFGGLAFNRKRIAERVING